MFPYEQVLVGDLGPDHLGGIHARGSTRPKTLPTVLGVDEGPRLLGALPLPEAGAGGRLGGDEACTLRVRDLDFARGRSSSATPRARRTGP